MRWMRNWQTSICGFLSLLFKTAAASSPEYAPILNPLGDALLAGGLMAAKDARTGSAPR